MIMQMCKMLAVGKSEHSTREFFVLHWQHCCKFAFIKKESLKKLKLERRVVRNLSSGVTLRLRA